MFFDGDKLKEGLTPDEHAEEILLSSKQNAHHFEAVRKKLIDKDFNLSSVEINYIALAFYFTYGRMGVRIKDLEQSRRELNDLIEILFEGEDPKLKEIIDI